MKCFLYNQRQKIELVRQDERNSRNITIATKSILKGFDNQTIADLTDMTVEEVEQIRTDLAKNSDGTKPKP